MNDSTDPGHFTEVLPPADPIVPMSADGSPPGLLPLENAGWQLSEIATAVIAGGLPVLAELFFRGTDAAGGALVSLGTIGYSLFAIATTALVQCARNEATRSWVMATAPAVVTGLILGLNYSDPANNPGQLGIALAIASGLFTLLSIFIGWRPARDEV